MVLAAWQPLPLAWACKIDCRNVSAIPCCALRLISLATPSHSSSDPISLALSLSLSLSLSQVVVVAVSVVALAGWCGSSTDQKMNGPE